MTERRGGRGILRRVFYEVVQPEPAEAETKELETKYGVLVLYKDKRISKRDEDFERESSFILSKKTGNVLLHRERVKVDGKTKCIDWYFSTEGPLKIIKYDEGYTRTQAVIVSLAEPLNGLGRGVDYSFKDGKVQDTYSSWSHTLSFPTLNAPKLDIKILQNEKDVAFLAWDGHKLVEEIFLPSQIDLGKWIPKIIDSNDAIIEDPALPWEKWFEELGVEYSQNSELKY